MRSVPAAFSPIRKLLPKTSLILEDAKLSVSSRFPCTLKSQCVTDFCCESAGVTLVKFACFHRRRRERSATQARPRRSVRTVETRKHTSTVLAASRTSSWEQSQYLQIRISNGIIRDSSRCSLWTLLADCAHREEGKQTGLKREKRRRGMGSLKHVMRLSVLQRGPSI